MPWWLILICAVGLVVWFFRFLQTGNFALLLLGIVWPLAVGFGYWQLIRGLTGPKHQRGVPNRANSVSIETRNGTGTERN